MGGPRHTASLIDILRRENVVPLLVTATLANGACLLISLRFGAAASGSVYDEITVSGIQFGQLSCLALWLALVASNLAVRLTVSAALLTGSCLTLAYSGDAPRGVELATLLIIHVVAVWLTARGLRTGGLLRTFDVLQQPTSQQFSLREVFAWMTAFAVLAFLSRFAELPRGADVWELVFFIGGGLLLANLVAALVAEVTPALQVPLSVAAVFILTVVVDRGTAGSEPWGRVFVYYGIQAAVLLSWINASRAIRERLMSSTKIAVTLDRGLLRRLDQLVEEGRFTSRGHILQEAVCEKCDRLDESRLARERAKLNPVEEKQLAEERLAEDFKNWPE